MPRHKSKSKPTSGTAAVKPAADNSSAWVSGPKVRELLDISAPTLWRWRHDKVVGFPPAKEINGRLYFPLAALTAWQSKQRQAA